MPNSLSKSEIESGILEIVGYYESRLRLRGLSLSSDFQGELGADDITLLEICLEVAGKFNVNKDALTDDSILAVGDLINAVASALDKG